MKAWRSLFALLAVWLWPGMASAEVPEGQWLRLQGKDTVRLSDYRGKLVWLDFWASWCGPCRKSLPAYQQLWQRYRQLGFEVLAVSLDEDRAAAQGMVEPLSLGYTLLWDGEQRSPAQFGVRAMPMAFLIDASGKVVWSHAGFRPGDEVEIARQIEARLP